MSYEPLFGPETILEGRQTISKLEYRYKFVKKIACELFFIFLKSNTKALENFSIEQKKFARTSLKNKRVFEKSCIAK